MLINSLQWTELRWFVVKKCLTSTPHSLRGALKPLKGRKIAWAHTVRQSWGENLDLLLLLNPFSQWALHLPSMLEANLHRQDIVPQPEMGNEHFQKGQRPLLGGCLYDLQDGSAFDLLLSTLLQYSCQKLGSNP